MSSAVRRDSVRHQVARGDAVIAAVTDGDEDHPWLILSNSLAADLGMWADAAARLAGEYRVLQYDTRGHGDSSTPPGPYSFDDLAGDVLTLMDHFGMASATFVGLSLGGMTGLKLALDHPGRVRRLVCCDARATMPPATQASWDERATLARTAGMAAVADDTIDRWITPATRARAPETVENCRRMIRRTSPEGYAGCIAAIKTAAFQGRLPALTVPTAYVVGECDSGAPAEVMAEMAAQTPGGQLHTVPAAAHLSNLDAPDAFAAALREALGTEAR